MEVRKPRVAIIEGDGAFAARRAVLESICMVSSISCIQGTLDYLYGGILRCCGDQMSMIEII